MNFLVVVACAAGVQCPLNQPIRKEAIATSEQHCRAEVIKTIKAYGFKSTDFSIECRSKGK